MFTLQSNQHGTLNTQAVQADLVTPAAISGQSAVSSDTTVLAVAPNPGFPDQFIVTAQGKAGAATITVTGLNGANHSVSTPFDFTVSQFVDPTLAVAFLATFTNVGNN
jgi:hypothetical protein